MLKLVLFICSALLLAGPAAAKPQVFVDPYAGYYAASAYVAPYSAPLAYTYPYAYAYSYPYYY